jgi:hypothetical protein
MNYYNALQLETGGWHYVSQNRREGTHPVGYCAQWREDKTHVHATEEEARECFRRYLLDGQREEEYGDWTGCEVCDAPTKKGLTARPPLGNGFAFCDEHRTSEALAERVPAPGQIIASY